MSNENNTEEMESSIIPALIIDRSKKAGTKSSKKKDLEFIKVGNENLEKKDWKIVKELDDLIGLILSKQDEPEKSVIEYSLFNNNDNKTERIKGIIKVKN